MQVRRRAFTLIELLVVIAVIGILAAIIFPVFSRARAEAYRSGDLTGMNALRNAVLLYREDQGAFPPQLLGYASLYASGPQAGNVIPANRINSYLFPRRVSSIESFRPANNRVPFDQVTVATWPNQDPREVGRGAQYDLTGDGQIDLTDDDPAGARQAFGPADGCVMGAGGADSSCSEGSGSNLYYSVSGYDVARNPFVRTGVGAGAQTQYELRYTLFWSNWGVGSGNEFDDPRQLGYNNPPDDTVITWNSWWREYEAGSVVPTASVQPGPGRRDVVLTVGGAARPGDSRGLFARSWRFLP
jgi:prepilin-type N-terminal cleavage/methylation domain-containing protein